MLSISEVVKELGISRQALNRKIKQSGINKTKNGRRVFLEESDVEKLRAGTWKQRTETKKETETDTVSILKKELEAKNQQIQSLQQALNQSQQLHAYDKRAVEELTSRVKLLEAPRKWKFLEWIKTLYQ